jgi:hypothetical protein
MSSEATISVEYLDGSIRTISVHFDGYPWKTGELLKQNFTTKEKVNQLLNLGNASFLDKSIDCPKGHSFKTPLKGYSVFYERDRGDQNQESRAYKNLDSLKHHLVMSWAEFHYVFSVKENSWSQIKIN